MSGSTYDYGNGNAAVKVVGVDASGNAVLTAGDAVSVADGADVTQGAKADAAITDATASGTQTAFLKGLVKILADIWDATNHLLAVNVKQVNGVATTMGNGVAGTGVQRVTLASDSTGQAIALGNVASAATDSGNPVKTGGKYNSAVPTLTDGQRGDTQLDSSANTKVVLGAVEVVSTASMVSLASTAASQTLLNLNTARAGLILNNTDANAVLLKYGATASASSFTVRIQANGYWEMPQPIYTGRIDAIWEADGSGSLFGSEL